VRIGISGHQYLEDPREWEWVGDVMRDLLLRLPRPLVGVTCLAVGADSLLATLLEEQNQSFEVVLPFADYESRLPLEARDEYRRLLDQARGVTTLQDRSNDEESYFEAGKMVVDLSDVLITIWNGKAAKRLGGTGDIVQYARQKQKPIVHLDPVRKVIASAPPLERLIDHDTNSPRPIELQNQSSLKEADMKDKKKVEKTNQPKEQSDEAKPKGGGRLDGRTIKKKSGRR
jgi:hypothetical protein